MGFSFKQVEAKIFLVLRAILRDAKADPLN
jgi:hypothetical protein